MMFVRYVSTAALAATFLFSANATAFAETTAATSSISAPADEYFGPLGLSVIGIQNSISKNDMRLDMAGLDQGDVFKNVNLLEVSVRDWESKYPRDRWLPRTVLALHNAYRRMAGEAAALHAIDVAAWLLDKYPSSEEAQGLRAELAGEMAPVTEVSITSK
jgi:hypothetical protein